MKYFINETPATRSFTGVFFIVNLDFLSESKLCEFFIIRESVVARYPTKTDAHRAPRKTSLAQFRPRERPHPAEYLWTVGSKHDLRFSSVRGQPVHLAKPEDAQKTWSVYSVLRQELMRYQAHLEERLSFRELRTMYASRNGKWAHVMISETSSRVWTLFVANKNAFNHLVNRVLHPWTYNIWIVHRRNNMSPAEPR